MGVFERYLSLWVALCIGIGVVLGRSFPALFEAIALLEVAHVNVVVAVFIWVMIFPMMVQIDFTAVKEVGKDPKGLMLTLVINWLIKPLSMAALGWLYFEGLFANVVSPETVQQYIAGMILLGVTPCTAMVFVWSQQTKGGPKLYLGAGVRKRYHHNLCPNRRIIAWSNGHSCTLGYIIPVCRSLCCTTFNRRRFNSKAIQSYFTQ